MTDTQLVARALAGDARAFGALVTRYQDLAISVAYAATGDPGLSEDLAQEAFVIAWRRLASLAHRERFAPWLCGIVRHVGRSERRHRNRHAPAGSPEPLDALAAARPSPLDEAMAREALGRTWHALRALPPRYREPLVLYCRLDHSHARVAASLGLSEETVRQRVSRARQRLRDEVEGVERTVGRAARRPLAAGVLALIWARSAGAARAASSSSPWLVGIAAPVAAIAAVLVLTAAAVTALRTVAPAGAARVSAAQTPASPPLRVASRTADAAAAELASRASVEMGAGAVQPAAGDATAEDGVSADGSDRVEFDFTAARGARRGRVVRHGPAVVTRETTAAAARAARPLLRPTLDIDPASFLP